MEEEKLTGVSSELAAPDTVVDGTVVAKRVVVLANYVRDEEVAAGDVPALLGAESWVQGTVEDADAEEGARVGWGVDGAGEGDWAGEVGLSWWRWVLVVA